MELKEAYVDQIVCHHFSLDPTKSLINHSQINLAEVDTIVLKDFFVKPFSSQKAEFGFMHAVDLAYNVVYQCALNVFQGEDFVNCSQKIFRHLVSVSSQPSIKDGDVFIAKISDILENDTYYEGLGIYKIEKKSEFIETYTDKKGNMQFSIKNGFTSNKIDKACLIVFMQDMPKCYLIDTSKDAKFWRQNFLGLIPWANGYSRSKAVIQVFQSFVSEELAKNNCMTKDEQINMINKWTESVKSSEKVSIDEVSAEVLGKGEMQTLFADYCRAYEEREKITLGGSFEVDKKAISVPKKIRTIKLDDSAEINLMKTGSFIERGYDQNRGLNYYKLYFSKEK